ncbi:MAG TPA: DUF58 domain-containing protein, partial [Phnomibacter sp.]|nr:DUF58 domain-containing protein [Phnomibacter sp.]
RQNTLQGYRSLPERFSMGDLNTVSIELYSHYPAPVHVELMEEFPAQLQYRQPFTQLQIAPQKTAAMAYQIRPLSRGTYAFGHLVCLVQSKLGLLRRRLLMAAPATVKVYPSYQQLRNHQIRAIATQYAESGNQKLRKLGHSLEFDQIKDYVPGDDVRQLNWKATARKNGLMVNHFMDERSQQVYCLIDKGRLMKMPFDGLALLDYAINATLVMGHIALRRQDKFGLLTFAHKPGNFVAAQAKSTQMHTILETLYQQDTEFLESDFEKLYLQVRAHIKQRSLLVLFTNFESMSGLKRQLPYLQQLNRHHLVLVVFFENTELKQMAFGQADEVETVYSKTIAWKFGYEKRLMVKELSQHGILSILTAPHDLTVAVINKYVELKTRHAI